jgi:hypothetical protein
MTLLMSTFTFSSNLQCALPAFEGLFPPPFDKQIQNLLFVLAYWHGIAKLRLHTDSTLNLLEGLTTQFGTLLRRFVKDTEKLFSTTELPRETAARGRRRLAAQAKGKGKLNRSLY